MRKLASLFIALSALALLISAVACAPGGGGEGGGGESAEGGGAADCCACATAYASTNDGYVTILRQFRDEYLMTNPAGRNVAAMYYNLSPPVARSMSEHSALKPIGRIGFLPGVAISTAAVDTTLVEKVMIASSVLLGSAVVLVWLRSRAMRGRLQVASDRGDEKRR